MKDFEVAFTAKGFAMFVEALTGRIITGAEAAPVIEQVVEPEISVVEQDEHEDEEPEVNQLVQDYMTRHIIPTRKKYKRTKSSKSIDKECDEVYRFMCERGEPVQLSTINRHMISAGYDWETKRSTMKIRMVIVRHPDIKKVGYGLYEVDKVTTDV